MSFSYDLPTKTVTFSIADFPGPIQDQLQSCLDINGFMSNEPKFRSIAAGNLPRLAGGDPELVEQLIPIVLGGNLLNLARDAEKPAFGLNFPLNTYQFSLDVVPGKPELGKDSKMAPLKEIQQIVKDEAWQKLREDLSWTKDNINSSLARLRSYLGDKPSYKKKVRVLNLLNGVARGGIMTTPIERMQHRLRKQLGVGVKEASKFQFDPNSTENEGRYRLRDPKDFDKESFRRWIKWAGVEAPKGITFVVGSLSDGKKALQAIRFNKALWDEAAASKFWDSVEKKPGFNRTWSWKKVEASKTVESTTPISSSQIESPLFKEAGNKEWYLKRLEDPKLLDKAFTITTPKGPELIVPPGGKRKIGRTDLPLSAEEAKNVAKQLEEKGFTTYIYPNPNLDYPEYCVYYGDKDVADYIESGIEYGESFGYSDKAREDWNKENLEKIAMKQHFDKSDPLVEELHQWKATANIKTGEYEDLIGETDKGEPIVVTQKADGQLVILSYDNGKVQLISKEGRVWEDTPVEAEVVKLLSNHKNIKAICELFAVDKAGKPLPYDKGMSIIRKPLSKEDEARIRLAVLDILSIDGETVTGDYWQRILLVRQLFGGGTLVKPIIAKKGDTSTIVDMWENGVLEQGWEGLVVHHDGVTKLKRQEPSIDLAVIGIERSKKHPEETGALLLAYLDDKGFHDAGKVGVGLSDADRIMWMHRAQEDKIREEGRIIWMKPKYVVEVQSRVLNVRETPLYNDKMEQIGEAMSAVGREPKLIHERPDKSINKHDLRLSQVPALANSMKKQADYPKHPDTIIIKPNEWYPKGLSEKQIWEYYDHIQGNLFRDLKDSPTMVVTITDGANIRRKDPKTGEVIRPLSITDIEKLNNGRNVGFSAVQPGDQVIKVYCDIDAHDKFSWDDTKAVTAAVQEAISKFPGVNEVQTLFSGNRGFYVVGWLNSPMNVNEARKQLRQLLDTEVVPKFDKVTTGIAKDDMCRLDVTTLHEDGALRTEFSINEKSGLICLNISKINKPLKDLEKSDFTIDKVMALRKQAARAYQPGDEVQFAHLPLPGEEGFPTSEENPVAFSFMKGFFDALKAAGHGVIIRDLGGNIYQVHTPTDAIPISGKYLEPYAKEIVHKIPIKKELTEEEKKKVYDKIHRLEKTHPEKARQLMEQFFSMTKESQVCDRSKHPSKNIAIDFDKTIATNLPDESIGEPLPGAIEALKKLKAAGRYIIIHSHRVEHQDGIKQILDWMKKYQCPFDEIHAKPSAEFYVDDKAIQFTNWDDVLKQIDQKKEAAFYPSLGSQPLWDQHPDGGGAADYKYPTEMLYPRDWWDTWNAYAHIDEKVDPAILMNLFRMMKKPGDKKEKDEAMKKYAAAFPVVTFNIDSPKEIAGKYQASPVSEDPKNVIYKVVCTEGAHPGLEIGDFNTKDLLKYPIKPGHFAADLREWLKDQVTTSAPLITMLAKKQAGDVKERLSWKTKVLQRVIVNDWKEALKISTDAQASEAYIRPILERMFEYLLKTGDYAEVVSEAKKWNSFKTGTPYYSSYLSKNQDLLKTLGGIGLAKEGTDDYKQQVKMILDGNEEYPNGGSDRAKMKVIRDLSAPRLQEFITSDNFKKQSTVVQDATLLRLKALGSGGEEGLFMIWGDKELPSPLRAAALKELVLVYGHGASSRGYEDEGSTTKQLLEEATSDPDSTIREMAFRLMQHPDISYMPWTSKGKFVSNEKEKEDTWNQPSRDIPEAFLKKLSEEADSSVRNSTFDLIRNIPHDIVKENKPQEFEFTAGTLPGIQKFVLMGLNDKEAVIRRKVRDYFGLPPEKPAEEVKEPTTPAPEEKKPEAFPEGEMFKRASPLSPKEGIPEAIKVEGRQPPTTWPLGNPSSGYGSAFPRGDRDYDLLLDDTRQFYDRPHGKFRSYVQQLWDILFKNKKRKQEEGGENPAEAKGVTPKAVTASELPKDEAGLLDAIPEASSAKLMQIFHQAKEQNLMKVIQALAELPGTDPVHEKALDALAEAKDIPALQNAINTPAFNVAIKHLVALGRGDELKRVFKEMSPEVQRSIVYHLGQAGDKAFLEKALENPNAEVREQAVKWLAFYHEFDILREHLKKEKDGSVKKEIQKELVVYKAPEAPVAEVIEQFKPEEREKKIAELVDTATKAFNRWRLYPEVRRKVLGETGQRYDISTFRKWVESQPEIDEEVQEEMSKLPSMEQGREALSELKNILKKLPETDKNITYTKDWIDETWKRLHIAGDELPPEERKKWEDEIEKAKEKLSLMQSNSKGDLEFKINQLEAMEEDATTREQLMHDIRSTPEFTKKYGSANSSWKDYSSYLQTFDVDTSEKKQLKDPSLYNNLESLEEKQDNLAWKQSEDLRKELEAKQKRLKDLDQQLKPFLQRLKTEGKFNFEIDEEGNPIVPEIKAIDEKLDMLKKFDKEWYHSAEAQEPFVEIEGEKYYMAPDMWVVPKSKPSPLPEYPRGKVRVPGRVSRFRSPWTEYIEKYQREKVHLQNKALQDVTPYLPPRAKEIQLEKVKSSNDIAGLSDEIKNLGVIEQGGKFVSYKDARKNRDANKKQYEEDRKNLLQRMDEMQKGFAETPKEKEDKAKELIVLRKDIKDFKAKYGVPPLHDSPKYNLIYQWHLDKKGKPYQRS